MKHIMQHNWSKFLTSSLFLFLVTFACTTQAQMKERVKWTTEIRGEALKAGTTVELVFKAAIDKDWVVYSSEFSEDLGPLPTSIDLDSNGTFKILGILKSFEPKTKFDKTWEHDIPYFSTYGEFTLKAKLLSDDFNITANIRGLTCSDVDGQCIPINKDVTFNKNTTFTTVQKEEIENKFSTSSAFGSLPLHLFLILAFLGGLAAIFTPCVFPMIPLTVSFFSGPGKGKMHALFYGLSIIAIYAAVGAVLAPLLGSSAAITISTHWFSNLIFFLVFFLFALSFFGMFDIELPSSFVNKMDAKSDKSSGFLGVFFMAFTLTLVSFSCTGPIVGSFLVASAGGEFVRPVLGMASFGAGFGLPFLFFALFPRVMDNLPKSGGWLNGVKVTFGFIELALALKFFGMIDQVYHLDILSRDLNVAIWIAIFSFMGLYYLGKIQLPHDTPISKISVPRLMLALVSFTFVIYLIPGLFGAPLRALSGVLPPITHQEFDINESIRQNSGWKYVKNNKVTTTRPKYNPDELEFPHGFSGYFDYEEGIEAARKAGKPIILDFTGHSCANCRKMEDNVWVASGVRERLENDWIIIGLYTDSRTKLPKEKWVTSELDGKIKKTMGDINFDLEMSRFGQNAQPFYVLLGHEEQLLADAIGYEPDARKFIEFLDSGLEEFKKSQ